MTLTLATLTIALAPAVVISAVYLLVRQQLRFFRQRLSLPPDRTAELSVDRYRPMFRLLEEDDIRFLQSQPGATPAMVNRLRNQRYRLFKAYLRTLEGDFDQACAALTAIALQSQDDRRDVIRALVLSRAKFEIGTIRVRCRLLLYRWNVGREPVAHLVNLFEGLQLELIALVPATEQAKI